MMVALGLFLLLTTLLWALQPLKPLAQVSLYQAVIAALFLLTLLPLIHPTATFDAASHTFLWTARPLGWMPTTVDRRNALPTILQTLGSLGALLVAADLMVSPRWRQRFCLAAAVTTGVVVMVGILEKMGPLAWAATWLQDQPRAYFGGGGGVPFGTFGYHGNAATFINLGTPAVAAMAIRTQALAWRRVWLAVLAACYVAVVLNVSRAGLAIAVLLVPVVMGTVYWHISRHRMSLLGMGLAVLVLSGGVVVTGRSPAVRRLAGISKVLANPYYDRAMTYRTAWDLAKQQPVWGWGPGSYRLLVQTSPIRGNYFAPWYVPGESFSVLSDVEEDYLQTLVEWGWVGLAVWAVLPVGGMVCLWRAWRVCGKGKGWPYVLIGASLVSVFVHALSDCPLQNSAIQLYVAVLLGMAWSSRGWVRGGAEPVEISSNP
jgi:O-antigen ligase